MTTQLTYYTHLTPAQNGATLGAACRRLNLDQRAIAARSLTAEPPTSVADLTLRTVAALLVQGVASTVAARGAEVAFGCRYRGAGGRACAVGLWIADELYVPDMDAMMHVSLVIQRLGWAPEVSNRGALLQTIHDSAHTVSVRNGRGWVAALRERVDAMLPGDEVEPVLELIDAYTAAVLA